MAALCAFANSETPDAFIHPVLRAVMVHFWLAYDHPFVDGNGRTARALFYWAMLRAGYWLWEYVSLSRVLLKAPAQYGRAFLETETDGNDLTYFLLHQTEAMSRALEELHRYILRRSEEVAAAERELHALTQFNLRQRALLTHALRHPRFSYTIEGHRRSHNVVYQTARNDLLTLETHGLLTGRKRGRAWSFTSAPDLHARLARPA